MEDRSQVDVSGCNNKFSQLLNALWTFMSFHLILYFLLGHRTSLSALCAFSSSLQILQETRTAQKWPVSDKNPKVSYSKMVELKVVQSWTSIGQHQMWRKGFVSVVKR